MRAIIFANGNFKRSSTINIEFFDDDLIIAADGGARHCLNLGIIPAALIGDMDSVQPELINEFQSQGTQLVVYPRDKDQIDLELALSYAMEQGAQEILLFGLLGGRLDLSLANLMLLTKDDWQNLSFVVVDGPDTAYILHDNNAITLHGTPGDIVSLIPLSAKVITVSTLGLRWSLKNANLELGNTLSISNELLENSAEIKIGNGKLLLIHHSIPEIDGKD